MWTAAPDSRSNRGRMLLKAALRLDGAPTVSGSACMGAQAQTMAASPATAAITTWNVPICTLNLRKSAGCADDARLHARRAIHETFATNGLVEGPKHYSKC